MSSPVYPPSEPPVEPSGGSSEQRNSDQHHTHCKCGAHWGGLRTCHCSAAGCHQTFTSITAFDMHRAGSHPESTRHCLDPAAVGLVDAGRAYPCWGQSGEGDPRWD